MSVTLQRRTVLLGSWLVLTSVVSAQAPVYPLKLNPTGTYVVDQNNRPYFMNGDAGWSLITKASQGDAELYLENRRQKGFNVIIADLIEHDASGAYSNFYGQRPFLTPGDFNTPNEAYFAQGDWVLNDAASKGMAVLLFPLYLGFNCGTEGFCGEVRNSSLATMRNWGRYVGTRYRTFPNLVWVIGGDVDPVSAGVADKVQEFVAGLLETDTTHLISAHNVRGQSAVTPWPGATWLNLNNIYTDAFPYSAAATEYNRAPFKPFFLIESYYENEHNSTPLSLRSQVYWTVLGGGLLGHFFGNCPVWSLGSAPQFCSPSGLSWQTQLDSTGATTVAFAGPLFNSRAFYNLVPDLNHQVMTAGYQSGATYATAARANDGSTVIAFIPTSRAVTLDMTKIAGGNAKVWWYNTRTGAPTLVGTFPTSGNQSFTPPDASDWVLVADNATLNLPAPGTQGTPPAAPTNLHIVP